LDRLITVIILNSLPIALYGFIQHNELDPLPWGGDVTQRIASNMGNPIFVAAYLIMAALPTLARVVGAFRSILTDEDTGTADVLRAAAYIFMLLVQIIAIWYSGSRGPQMGLLAGLGVWMFLGLLALQRAGQTEQPLQPHDLPRDLGRGLLFGLGSLAGAGAVAAGLYFASRALTAPGSSLAQWIAMGAAVLTLLGTWMAFIVNRWGWRWLWISALLIAIFFSVGFLAVNLVEPIHEWSRNQPWLGRLDDVLQAEGGTGKVRSLLWEQALAMSLPHEPIEYPPTTSNPTWRPDPFNAIRPLVGYGPESMFVAGNRFYPPLLGHYEARTSSGDRAHNETMDTLVITGLLGFSAYLWLFGSVFFFGLRWMGLLPGDWRRTVFFVLQVLGSAITIAIVATTVGPHFFGLAIPVGMVGGLVLYLIVYGFSRDIGYGGPPDRDQFWNRHCLNTHHLLGLRRGIRSDGDESSQRAQPRAARPGSRRREEEKEEAQEASQGRSITAFRQVQSTHLAGGHTGSSHRQWLHPWHVGLRFRRHQSRTPGSDLGHHLAGAHHPAIPGRSHLLWHADGHFPHLVDEHGCIHSPNG
jgi:MFS family permease